jgi:hypothetical protein
MTEIKTTYYRVRQGDGATHLINLDNVTLVSHSGEGASERLVVHFVSGEPLSLNGVNARDFISLLERMARDAQVIHPPNAPRQQTQ